MKTLFDSEQFAYRDITLQIGSRKVTGLRGVSYKKTVEKEYVYGMGSKPQALQWGNESYEGEIKLLQNELELLIKEAKKIDPSGDITKLRDQQITIVYENGEVLVTDILTGVEFTEMEKAMEQGAKFMEVTLPIMFLDLKLNQ